MANLTLANTRLQRPRLVRISWRINWIKLLLWGIAALIAAALLLPAGYLAIRALGAVETTWQTLIRVRTLATLGRTLGLAAAVTLLTTLIAVPLAWLTTRSDLPFRKLWAVLTPLPLVIPSYVGAYLFVSALGPRGLLQQTLQPLGIERLPSLYGFPGALLVLSLLNYPYILLSVRAALLRMNPALEDASRSLGDSPWTTFWRVIMPHLRPALGAGGLLVALYTLRDFGAVSMMRYTTFTRAIYLQYQSFNRESAAASALVLVALTLVIVVFEARTRGRARYDNSGSVGSRRPPATIALGRWRWPALLFCGGVVFFALILPATLLVYWLVRGILAGEVIGGLALATWHSILGSGLAALAAIVAAVPVTILAVRYAGRLAAALERATYLTFALPGVVVALALVFFGANYLLPLYLTLPMLIVAYVILFLPQATGALRASLLQVHPSLEESARSLGRSSLGVFRSITLPIAGPGIGAGVSLVFLTAMKELPATLILAPFGFNTLATSVWSAVSEAFFAQAAAPALLIILTSSLPMAFLVLREHKANA